METASTARDGNEGSNGGTLKLAFEFGRGAEKIGSGERQLERIECGKGKDGYIKAVRALQEATSEVMTKYIESNAGTNVAEVEVDLEEEAGDDDTTGSAEEKRKT